MPRHSNALSPAQWAEFSSVVQSRLWPALKGRISAEELQQFISGTGPEAVMLRLRKSFIQLVPEAESLLAASPFFANEEVESNYGYPQGYAVKPVCEQLVELSKHFNGLNTNDVLACSKELPALSAGAEGWFAVPRWEKVAKTYNEAVEKVLDLIGKTRTFYNYRKGNLGPKYLRMSERTAVALQMLGDGSTGSPHGSTSSPQGSGDFLLIPAQFGLTHRGRSVRRVRVVYAPNEFGLGSFIAGCMILSHPERLVQWEQLYIDCPGDEYSPDGDGVFSNAPIFVFSDGKVRFDADWVDRAYGHDGSATGFLPIE